MNGVLRYVAKRLIMGVGIVIFVSVLVFAIMQAMPGNPIDLMLDTRVSPERVAELKAQWGLDEPPIVQYFVWLGNILQGDFGMSVSMKQNVSDLILQRHVTGPEEQDELLMDIREQSMWLTRTMENILSMTKIESGADFISRREEVVEDLVYEAESHVSGLREHRRFQDSMPEEVLIADVDARLIVQVLVNLLDNAVKHTKENGLIRLNVSYQDGRAYFVVEDNGPGIEPGQEETIFGEFVSLAGRGPDQKHGMGLGLAICREVVKAHGGEIRAENRPEGGARFVFWLNAQPAVQMEEMEEEYGGTERDGREADHIDR